MINVANFCFARCLWVQSDVPLEGLNQLLAGSGVEIDEISADDFIVAYESPSQAQALISEIETFGEVRATTPHIGFPSIGIMNAA